MDVIEYADADGRSPFELWFAKLDSIAAAKITVSLARLASGNLSNVKSVGEGVQEQRVDFGPGYRVYFGREADRLIILLGGGTKRRQEKDIAQAIACWRDYRVKRKER